MIVVDFPFMNGFSFSFFSISWLRYPNSCSAFLELLEIASPPTAQHLFPSTDEYKVFHRSLRQYLNSCSRETSNRSNNTPTDIHSLRLRKAEDYIEVSAQIFFHKDVPDSKDSSNRNNNNHRVSQLCCIFTPVQRNTTSSSANPKNTTRSNGNNENSSSSSTTTTNNNNSNTNNTNNKSHHHNTDDKHLAAELEKLKVLELIDKTAELRACVFEYDSVKRDLWELGASAKVFTSIYLLYLYICASSSSSSFSVYLFFWLNSTILFLCIIDFGNV